MQIVRFILISALISGAAQAQRPSVLLISIDGMRPDYVTRAEEHHLRVPTLRGMMQSGSFAEGVTGVFPTVTYPSHTTLVTGVWPARHGIVNNRRFDPEDKMGGAWYWYEDQIKVPTLWSVAHAAGLSTASVGWPVTADAKDIDFLIPEYWRASVSDPTNTDDRFLMNALSRPANELERIAARIEKPYMQGNETTLEGDETKTEYALDILKQHKPKFMTIHLSSLDEEEHLHGPFSAEANEDLERLDGMVARLIAQERANDPRSIVAIVSDHGFADIDHQLNIGAAFLEAGLMQPASPDHAATWQAQPWSLGGMIAVMLHNPSDPSVRQKVKALLDKLATDPANGIEAILDASQVAALGGVPEASFVLTLRKGYIPGANLSGTLVTSIPGHHGTHGYNPHTVPEMRASFFLSGTGVARGKNLGIVDMRSIAPTVAKLLGINLPDAKQAPIAMR